MNPPNTEFAPANPTDNRELLEWQSRYPDPTPRLWIRIEAVYLASLLLLVPVAMLALWLEYPRNWLQLSDQKYRTLFLYGLAWLGGTFGGTLFDIKWLYHSVARQIWHMDRRLWRLFTPHLSGGLSLSLLHWFHLAWCEYLTVMRLILHHSLLAWLFLLDTSPTVL